MTQEKRRTPRIAPFVAPCRIRIGARQLTGFVTDLSPDGARVVCDALCPEKGEDILLELRLGRKARHPQRLPGRVAWSKPAGKKGHSFGLSFAGLASGERAAVEAVVEEFHRLASQLS